MDSNNSSKDILQKDDNVRLNDVVLSYMVQYGLPFTVDHYNEIRESYYQQRAISVMS